LRSAIGRTHCRDGYRRQSGKDVLRLTDLARTEAAIKRLSQGEKHARQKLNPAISFSSLNARQDMRERSGTARERLLNEERHHMAVELALALE
jgi:hypothetical protein